MVPIHLFRSVERLDHRLARAFPKMDGSYVPDTGVSVSKLVQDLGRVAGEVLHDDDFQFGIRRAFESSAR